jgi:hypothetical protein
MSPEPQHISPGQAVSLFWSCTFKGWIYRLWARITRRTPRLLDLDETLKSGEIAGSHYVGIKPVDIHEIHGTQGKADAFDDTFHPTGTLTRSRWLSIAKAKLLGRDLPPVDLVLINGIYYVRDGHHRISVSRTLGQDFIDAEITIVKIRQRMF